MNREISNLIGDNKYQLSLGKDNEHLLESALASGKEYEEFDIWYEISSDEDLSKLKDLYQRNGEKVKKLDWSNWGQRVIAAADVVEMLNYFPNLKSLKFSSWNKPLSGDVAVNSLKLTKLCCFEISESGKFIIDFLSTALPENVIKCVKICHVSECEASLISLINKQSSIKRLNLSGQFTDAEPLKNLKLSRFRCILYKDDKNLEKQLEYLESIIKSQPELTELDLLNESDYSYTFVDDKIFSDICALSKLEKLLIGIDLMTPEGIKSISKLQNLKNMELKTNREVSLGIFKELSSIKLPSLEYLNLNLWSFDLPKETYEAMGQNFENLKATKIRLGTRHSINFFARALPSVEELTVKFGEANNTMEFDQAFDGNDLVTNTKLKKLSLNFWGQKAVNTENFFKCLEMFKSLESLKIHSKFPFSAEFITQLSDRLGTIKSLNLSSFSISSNETFPPETSEALKHLRTKLKYASLSFSNVQNCFPRGPDEEDDTNQDFTFQTLIDALKDVYKVNVGSMANIRVYHTLTLTAGEEN